MARIGPRRFILSILAAWAQKCQNGPQETNFECLGGFGPDMEKSGSQETHFGHFGGLGPDMARMGPMRLILSVLAAWAQIWPE